MKTIQSFSIRTNNFGVHPFLGLLLTFFRFALKWIRLGSSVINQTISGYSRSWRDWVALTAYETARNSISACFSRKNAISWTGKCPSWRSWRPRGATTQTVIVNIWSILSPLLLSYLGLTFDWSVNQGQCCQNNSWIQTLFIVLNTKNDVTQSLGTVMLFSMIKRFVFRMLRQNLLCCDLVTYPFLLKSHLFRFALLQWLHFVHRRENATGVPGANSSPHG